MDSRPPTTFPGDVDVDFSFLLDVDNSDFGSVRFCTLVGCVTTIL